MPNPTARFVPTLMASDFARMIGFDAEDRRHRSKAREAFERLAEDGVIDLLPEGRREWWILGVRTGRELEVRPENDEGVAS